MQSFPEVSIKPKTKWKDDKGKNGLHNLVVYYQHLFDRDENNNHYSAGDYQNAKRNFVKYSLEQRKVWDD